jgi:hypothetical protein
MSWFSGEYGLSLSESINRMRNKRIEELGWKSFGNEDVDEVYKDMLHTVRREVYCDTSIGENGKNVWRYTNKFGDTFSCWNIVEVFNADVNKINAHINFTNSEVDVRDFPITEDRYSPRNIKNYGD